MDKHASFLLAVERYCAANNTNPDSLCRKATGDPRRWRRIKQRIARTDDDIKRIRALMAASKKTADKGSVT